MAIYLHIAEPCHEDWNNMQSAQQGRHCLACCKTVVDFTRWNIADIAAYLADTTNKKTCGRFYESQLNVPVSVKREDWVYWISKSALPSVKKIAAIIIVVFGLTHSACHEPVTIGNKTAPDKEHVQGVVLGESGPPIELVGDTILVTENESMDSVQVCRPDTRIK